MITVKPEPIVEAPQAEKERQTTKTVNLDTFFKKVSQGPSSSTSPMKLDVRQKDKKSLG